MVRLRSPLILSVIEGLNMTFEELGKKISPTLKRITYKLNGHFSFFNDEDLYQEALIHLWQDFRDRKLEDKTDSYMLQGCYFHLKNYIRKAKLKPGVISLEELVDRENSLELEDILSFQGEGKDDHLNRLDNKLLTEAIKNNGLTDREKNILFSYAQGLTTREIGKRVGVSHVTVVKQLAVIREKCKKYFD